MAKNECSTCDDARCSAQGKRPNESEEQFRGGAGGGGPGGGGRTGGV
jgi:hypothetical protein